MPPVAKPTTKRTNKRAEQKAKLVEAKQYALDSTLWTGDNVIVANAIQFGVQHLQLNAKRVVYLGLSKIDPQRESEARLTPHGWGVNLYAKNFSEIFGIIDEHVYELMALGVAQLLRKTVTFEYIDSETQKVVECEFPWCSSASYIKGEGRIELVFNDLMTPFITRLAAKTGGYTLQKIKQSGGIRSLNGWRLFDLLTTQRDNGILKIATYKLMTAMEVTEKTASDYYTFKRSVLLPAIDDIQKNAKLHITFEEAKSGRRITSLTFKFKDDPAFVAKQMADKVIETAGAPTPTRESNGSPHGNDDLPVGQRLSDFGSPEEEAAYRAIQKRLGTNRPTCSDPPAPPVKKQDNRRRAPGRGDLVL
jgi:hypothetical protein